MKFLRTLADFDSAVTDRAVVGISDTANGYKVHCFPCGHVKASGFKMKVIDNRRNNGAYARYETFEEFLHITTDIVCKSCRQRFVELKRRLQDPLQRAAFELKAKRPSNEALPATKPPLEPLRGGGKSTMDDLGAVLRWRGESRTAFEAWGRAQLDLMSKPPDPRGSLRREILTGLAELRPKEDQWLYATYKASALLPNSDVENVLFLNVDANSSAFRHMAAKGIVFEFVPGDPSRAEGSPGLPHCSVYEVAGPHRPSSAYEEAELLAEWRPTPVPKLRSATKCGPVWWDLGACDLQVAIPQLPPSRFAVHMTLHLPLGQGVNLAKHLKIVVDAAVLSLCHENGQSVPEGLKAFAEGVGRPEHEVRTRMSDASRSVFGAVKMVDRRGQAQPPDSGCVLGSLVVAHGTTSSWMLSGRVVSLASADSNLDHSTSDSPWH